VKLTHAFYVGQCEVTQAQYQRVVGSNPSKFKEGGPDAPVDMVNWEDAVSYCQRLSALPVEKRTGGAYRLATEAEWEYAARAGTTTAWCFGDDETGLPDYAWCDINAAGKTHPVAQKRPNAFGLFDVHGNVWEWCADWEAPYDETPVVDPGGPSSGTLRMQRGGYYGDPSRHMSRSAFRIPWTPDKTEPSVGFRVIRIIGAQATSPKQPNRAGRAPKAKKYPQIAGQWADRGGNLVIIVQKGNQLVADCAYTAATNIEVSWHAEGTISEDGQVAMKLVHLRPADYRNQVRTGTLSPDGKTIAGPVIWADGVRQDYVWTRRDPNP
jgi:hypothetical protein